MKTLCSYIKNSKRIGNSNKKIMRQLLNLGYPEELILEAFELNLKQEEKMAKKKEYEEEDEEEEDEEEEEEEEDDEEEEKPIVVSKKKDKEEKPKITINDILSNHDQRLQALEAKLFRMLSI